MKTLKSIFVALLLTTITICAKAQATNAAINNVVTAYLDVKNALTADDGATAAAKAKMLAGQINAVKAADLSPVQQGTWKNYVDKLSFDSRHISETTAIDHQREHFASLSKNMYAVLKAVKVNNETLYLQYCPMKKAGWLSNKPEIENPYFGKSMPNCGSVKETLKATK
ncbi:DUF3347 domain-containing protein [Mucilaginibacter sp. UR6-11]|uniref:DUF3347 domain-containing protein n=1 Tax=Mucilaginibacter sp. UR6-11 TaxID=1435644 RepID=UPI001E430AD1|nr:DUF3347 domain-containing protein [Mucilaginibacter sp. UR6-11]MCC8425422.1 DUF3347 domain-containing protein [Mucilaginibacter sp. UR6-11]